MISTGDHNMRKLKGKIRIQKDLVILTYCLTGNWSQLKWQKPVGELLRLHERKNHLWQTTCFEAFIGNENSYYEINMSPLGEWNLYHFDGYRKGMKEALGRAIFSERLEDPQKIIFKFVLEISGLSRLQDRRASLTAVTENIYGETSYWSTCHSGVKPDFHASESFTLKV